MKRIRILRNVEVFLVISVFIFDDLLIGDLLQIRFEQHGQNGAGQCQVTGGERVVQIAVEDVGKVVVGDHE